MAEYIEREAVLKQIAEEYDLNYGEILTDPYKFYQMVDFVPAADVVERKRGEWIDISCVVADEDAEDGYWIATQYQCSLCGRKEYKKEPFCNCGADMRGEKHE